jgi:hypothetical protein
MTIERLRKEIAPAGPQRDEHTALDTLGGLLGSRD